MKRLLIAATLLAIFATAAYAAPPADKGKPESPGKSQGQHGNGNANNPAKACKKERADMGDEAFGVKYGTNHNRKNAFGKCVSGKAKAKKDKEHTGEDEDENGAASNAAKLCKKERTDIGLDAFKTKYGTNPNKANAFGKCVSSQSKAKAGG
jgi:hypothetical protein